VAEEFVNEEAPDGAIIKVATYMIYEKPEMSAANLSDAIIPELQKWLKPDFIVLKLYLA